LQHKGVTLRETAIKEWANIFMHSSHSDFNFGSYELNINPTSHEVKAFVSKWFFRAGRKNIRGQVVDLKSSANVFRGGRNLE
jgi:hypothetical protein